MNVERKDWAAYVGLAANNIDYLNFKDNVHDRGGSEDRLDRDFGVCVLPPTTLSRILSKNPGKTMQIQENAGKTILLKPYIIVIRRRHRKNGER